MMTTMIPMIIMMKFMMITEEQMVVKTWLSYVKNSLKVSGSI